MAYECKIVETYPGFGPDLVTDGNMEDDPTTNWTAGGGAAIAPAASDRGCTCLEVTDGGAGGGYAYQDVTVEPGHRYRFETWGYSMAAGDTWRVRIYVAGSVVWTSATHDVLAPLGWENEVKFYRIPTGVTTIQIRLEVVGAAKVVFFDDVSVKREAPVPMTEIDLQYNVGAGYSLLNQGIKPGSPERVSLYGGRLQLELVRQEDGKRTIPLKLIVEGTTGQDLIERVNALEEMLRHAARYRADGWGGEVFLSFKIDDATHGVWFPVNEGEIDTDLLYEKCGGEQQDMIKDLPVWLSCGPYWESPYTYDLSNLLDNPGFEEWNGGICNSEPDGWTDYQTAGAAGRNGQETDTVEEGCEALRIELIAAAAGLYQGVTQNIGARVQADTEYTLLAWVQNEALTNGKVYIFVEGAGAAVRGTAINDGVARTDYTLVSCQFTPLAADVPANVHVRVRIEAVGGACTGIAHIDKMLVMEASNVPVGWKSSDYLANHYDRDALHINYTSVCDIPGEEKAEVTVLVTPAQEQGELHLAKRTRGDPCNYIWQLVPCEAYTTAETGGGGGCQPGLIDAVHCIDSDKIGDATSPSGSRIEVDFATQKGWEHRCYWDIILNERDYYGDFVLAVICKASGSTDIIRMRVAAWDSYNAWNQGDTIIQTVPVPATKQWELLDGWEVMHYPMGTYNRQWVGDVGDKLTILLRATTDAPGAPTDSLYIAGAYLIPVSESYLVTGMPLFYPLAPTTIWHVKDMDDSRGTFTEGGVVHYMRSNLGAVGDFPLLTPEIENYLYLFYTRAAELTITDTMTASIQYRPRGVFLRGANP